MFHFGIVYTISFTVFALLIIYDAFSKRDYTYLDCIISFFMVVTPVLNSIFMLLALWDVITSKAVMNKLNKPIFKNKE